MRLTKLLALLFAVGVIPLALSAWKPDLKWVGLGWDLLLLAFIWADYLVTPVPDEIVQVERVVDEKLSLGTENRVILRARYVGGALGVFGSRLRQYTIRDEPPTQFELAESRVQDVALSAGAREGSFSYLVTPTSKGDFAFGDIFIKVRGFFGLIERVCVISAKRPVMVYPNLHETLKYDLLSRRGRLIQVGIKAIRLRGGGSEFESLRDYVTGDEYRKIDWAATARRNKLIVRQYQAERAQSIVLMIDCGRAMLAQVQKMSKLDYVINTALMLAYVAASTEDKVGLMVFDSEVRTYLPPAKSKSQVYKILSALYNVSAEMVESDYPGAFSDLVHRCRRRSLVVLFSDLVDPEASAEILRSVPILEDKHRTVMVTVSDPNHVAAAKLAPQNEAEAYRKAVALQVMRDRRQAITLLRRRGVWTIDSPPESLSADLINHYLELKARSGI